MLAIERCKGDGDEADEHDIVTIEGDHVLDPGSQLRVHLEADSTGICLQSQLLRKLRQRIQKFKVGLER